MLACRFVLGGGKNTVNPNPVEKPNRPKEMELYDGFKWPGEVPNIEWDQLTLDQKKLVMEAYRFGGYKTGLYQSVSFHGPRNSVP